MFKITDWSLTKRLVCLLIVSLSCVLIGLYFKNDPEMNVNDQFVMVFLLASVFILALLALFLKLEPVVKGTILLVVAMTGFGFVMVPIYNVFCDIASLNGKVDLVAATSVPDGVDESRKITVEFVVNYNEHMVWKFKPQHKSVKIHPGELASTGYFATNPSNKTMIAQAIPSISPGKASKYFKKVECFCFSSQKLGPKETANLALRFYIDKDLPDDVKRITLAYTLFDITDKKQLHRMTHTS